MAVKQQWIINRHFGERDGSYPSIFVRHHYPFWGDGHRRGHVKLRKIGKDNNL